MNIFINVMSDPFFISGLIITLAGREELAGKTIHVPLESWQRTGTKRGEYYLYECYFFADFAKKRKKYRARAAVKPNDIHKLKKGLTLTVKYSDDKLPRIAVMNVFD